MQSKDGSEGRNVAEGREGMKPVLDRRWRTYAALQFWMTDRRVSCYRRKYLVQTLKMLPKLCIYFWRVRSLCIDIHCEAFSASANSAGSSGLLFCSQWWKSISSLLKMGRSEEAATEPSPALILRRGLHLTEKGTLLIHPMLITCREVTVPRCSLAVICALSFFFSGACLPVWKDY